MHKRRSKRSEFARLFALLTIFPLTIGILLAISVMYILGYRFNPSTHEVAQGGLIQLDSQPRGAVVTVDGKTLGSRTAAKLDTTAGSHTVTMALNGYLPWQKTVSLDPGAVLWLSYARFIPEKIAVSSQATYPKVDGSLAVNGQPILYLWPDQTQPEFVQVKVSGDTAKQTTIAIPSAIYTAAMASTFHMVATDPSGKYLLVSHTIGATSELLYIDVDTPSRSVNLTRLAGKQITHAEFDQTNTHRVFLLIDGALYNFDVGSTSLGSPILSNLAEISSDSDGVVAYVTQADQKTAQRTIGYITHGQMTPKTVRTFYDNGSVPLHFREGSYVNAHYFAIQYGQTLEIGAGGLPSSDSPDALSLQNIATVSLADTAGQMSFSPSGRFIMVQSGVTFMTYDLELNKLSTTSLRGDGADTSLTWLDDMSLLSSRGGTLQYYEFDGENSHSLLDNVASNQAVLSSDEHYLYALQKQPDGTVALVRLQLVLS